MTDEEKAELEKKEKEKAEQKEKRRKAAEAELEDDDQEDDDPPPRRSTRRTRRPPPPEDDLSAELEELEGKIEELGKELEKKTGVSRWVVYVPVALLFIFGVVLPVLDWVKRRRTQAASEG